MQLSLASPIALSPNDADYELRRFSQTTLRGRYNAEPVSLAVPYATVGLSVLSYGGAAWFGNCASQRTTAALVFALTETVLFVGLEKWIFGRAWPTNGRDPYAEDRLEHPSDAYVYRPFQRGIDAAFPSGHTATMFAFAAALRASTPQWGVLRYIGYPVAVAVGFGMWWGDHHWASDVLSGAMIGEAIGGAAGRAFNPDQASEQLSFTLWPTADGALLSVSGQL